MATYFYEEPSRTFGEYLLVPGYSSSETASPRRVSLKTPLVKYRKGQEECPLTMNIPMVSAIMQSVSGDSMAIALGQGGRRFLYLWLSVHRGRRRPWSRRVKSYKAGFVVSAIPTWRPTATLARCAGPEGSAPATPPWPSPTTAPANGKLLGIVTSRDYRVSRMARTDARSATFMTPVEKLVIGPEPTPP